MHILKSGVPIPINLTRLLKPIYFGIPLIDTMHFLRQNNHPLRLSNGILFLRNCGFTAYDGIQEVTLDTSPFNDFQIVIIQRFENLLILLE